MAGHRYHAFSEAPIEDLTPPKKGGLAPRLWARLALKLFWKMEREQVNWVIDAYLKNAVVGTGCRVTPRAWCINPGPRENIRIGENVICRGLLRSESFHPGTILIGDNVYIGDDTIISCAERIEIGRFTMLAHGVQIFDNDSHPTDPYLHEIDYLIAIGNREGKRPAIPSAAIKIGERVSIGVNAIIWKGVTIGDGAVVVPASFVTTDVPPFTMVGGNPARFVRRVAQNPNPEVTS